MKYPSDSNHFQKKYAPKPDLSVARQKNREEYAAKPSSVKAREAEENGLTNKQYYEEIAAEMEAIAKKAELSDDPNVTGPTIQDEIVAMSKKGNELYVKNRKGYKAGALEKPFPINRLTHEITHISGLFPHSLQGEMAGMAFEGGLNFGLALRQLDAEGIKKFQEGARTDYDEYVNEQEKMEDSSQALDHDFLHGEQTKKQYEESPAVHASKRDWAIGLAEGMYLREKMDRTLIEELSNKPKDPLTNKSIKETPRARYARLKAFSNAYSQRDHTPDYNQSTNDELHGSKQLDFEEDFTMLNEQNEVMFQCMGAPNAVIHLTKEERRAIKAVALGMCEPQDTPYPERLTAIKEALVHVGMNYDLPRALEERELENTAKGQHAKIKRTYESAENYESWKQFKANQDAKKAQQNNDEHGR